MTRPTRPSTRRTGVILTAGLVGALIPAAPALAHTGHSTTGLATGLLHPLTGPDHLLAMVAVGMIAALSSSRRIALLTPAGFVMGLLAGGLLGLGGIALPGTEMAIALSLISLGTLIAVALRRDSLLLPLAALLFGVAHGHAHGAELPMAASPVTYVIGFVAVSITLHATGAVSGILLRRGVAARVAAGTLVTTAGLVLLLGL